MSGPSELTNTSPQNGWLIRELAASDPYAFGSSSSGVGDSDFNPFKFYGLSGYAFDYARDRRRHTPLDNIGNLNPPSIQHQGYHALNLARHFGNLDSLKDPKDPNPVYFNVLRLGLVQYPTTWAIPFMLATTLVLAGVVALGFRRRRLTFSGMGLGVLVLVISLVTAPLTARLLWALLSGLVPKYQVAYYGHAVDEPLLLIVFASVTTAITATWYVLLQRVRKVSVPDLTIGALVVVVVIGLLNPPQSSYAITWPLLFTLLAVAYWFYSMKEDRESLSAAQVFALLAAAIVAIVLFVPNIYMTFTGSDTNDLFTSMVPLVALLGLLVPALHIIAKPQKWWLPAAAGVVAATGLAIALAV